MLLDETTGLSEAPLTLLFDTPYLEQVEALHHWRASFGPVSEIEAVDENLFVLHIRPGVWCWKDSGEVA